MKSTKTITAVFLGVFLAACSTEQAKSFSELKLKYETISGDWVLKIDIPQHAFVGTTFKIDDSCSFSIDSFINPQGIYQGKLIKQETSTGYLYEITRSLDGKKYITEHVYIELTQNGTQLQIYKRIDSVNHHMGLFAVRE